MSILNKIQNSLIVSCQPIDNGPMDSPQIVTAMALAAQIGGAAGLRIEGVANLTAVRKACSLPIIGIIKLDLADYAVRITPLIEHIQQLADAGADIIAFDATLRARPYATEQLIDSIHANGCLAMADCSDYQDAIKVVAQGTDIIGTTLSGYVSQQVSELSQPDFALIEQFCQLNTFIMAEGRYNSPALAAKAIRMGANAVTVGSAITRIENTSRWFSSEISQAVR